MARKPVRAAVGDARITCHVCGSDLFRERGVLLEFMKMAWADETAGLICWRCGFVHLFVNKAIKLYRAES
ncbi:hypothetical protein [Streptomyces sp. NPDC005507]|uniref:hypothetical protein n=1 Tax=unclassified Streptomyces TaxID=2593676 RepID=UPI00339E6506